MAPPVPPPEFAPGTSIPDSTLRLWLRCGSNVRVYRGCRITPPDRVSLGDYSQIDESVHIFAGEGVTIGRHVHLAFCSSISGGGYCEIGDFAGIGAGVRIITGTDLPQGGLTNPTIPAPLRSVARGRVSVGAHALIYTNSIVFPDVTIGTGAVVAAGSVVHHSLKSWAVYAGNPLVQVGVRDADSILAKAAALGHDSLGSDHE